MYGHWTVKTMGEEMKVAIEMDTVNLTCNYTGIYLVQYQDNSTNVIYQQNVSVNVDGK